MKIPIVIILSIEFLFLLSNLSAKDFDLYINKHQDHQEIVVQISYSRLRFIYQESSFISQNSISLAIIDKSEKQVYCKSRNIHIKADNYKETLTRKNIIEEKFRTHLKQGKYQFIAKLHDRISGKNWIVKKDFQIEESNQYFSPLSFFRIEEGKTIENPDESGRIYKKKDKVLLIQQEIFQTIDSLQYTVINEYNESIFSKEIKHVLPGRISYRINIADYQYGEYIFIINYYVIGELLSTKESFWIEERSSVYLNQDIDDLILQIKYFAKTDDIKRIKNAPDSLKMKAIDDFWKSQDPTPETERNELKEEFYKRIDIANKKYTIRGYLSGWQTDRGRIYIKYGEPDEIVSNPYNMSLIERVYAVEVWYYYTLDKVFVFLDKRGYGKYELYQGWKE